MTKEQIVEKVSAIVLGTIGRDREELQDLRDLEIVVTNFSEKRIDVRVQQMYKFVDISFATLKKLSEVFGTDNIDINNWSSRGCDTCDYDSCYAVEFNILDWREQK